MAIVASTTGTSYEPIPAGNYVARCYQMIHIGTVKETILGTEKILNKVRIGWELPTELKVFKEENGEQPMVISKEFTLSMHEKSTLRQFLKNWRSKDFTEDEAKGFDITKLIGVPCQLNIIHKVAKNGNTYAEIGNISMLMKGYACPPQINKSFEFNYDSFDEQVFNLLPDFLKDKMKTSLEYAAIHQPNVVQTINENNVNNEPADDLPF
jgi:sRNA-binding carbon storage regulator CsrA